MTERPETDPERHAMRQARRRLATPTGLDTTSWRTTRGVLVAAYDWATEPRATALAVFAGRRALEQALGLATERARVPAPPSADDPAAGELCVAVALWGESLGEVPGQPRAAALAFAHGLRPDRTAELTHWVRRLRCPPLPSLTLVGEVEWLVCAVLRDRPVHHQDHQDRAA